MAYSLDKPDDLPANVQSMSEADKKKWVGAYNSAYESCEGDDCDAEAKKAANAAVKKEKSSNRIDDAINAIADGLRSLLGLAPSPAREPTVDEVVAAVRAVSYNDIFKQVLEQGYTSYPQAWLNDVYDDNGSTFAVFAQDGMLYRSPVTLADGKATLGEWAQVVVEFADVTGGAAPEVKEPVYNDFMWMAKHPRTRTNTTIFRQKRKDGKEEVRWLSISCTAVLNRVGEIDSTALFQSFEDNFKTRSPNDPLPIRNFFHAGEAFRTGVVEWVAADGYCLLTCGLFDDSDIARAEIAAREANPDYWGESIEYIATSDPVMLRVGDGISIPTYNSGIFTGVACLPEDKAAALFTCTTQEVLRMKRNLTADQEVALLKLFNGDEAAVQDWLKNNPDALNRMISETGKIARSAQPTTPAIVVPEVAVVAAAASAPATPVVPEVAPAQADASAPATQARELDVDDELMKQLTDHILSSPSLSAIAGLPEQLAQLTQTVTTLSQQLSTRAVAQDKTLGEVGARLEALEQDENERRETYVADLPAARTLAPVRTRMTYRPREAHDQTPVGVDGQPVQDSSAIADKTLANSKTRNIR